MGSVPITSMPHRLDDGRRKAKSVEDRCAPRPKGQRLSSPSACMTKHPLLRPTSTAYNATVLSLSVPIILLLESLAPGDAMFVPQVLETKSPVAAIAGDRGYAYAQTVNGVYAWDRQGRAVRLSKLGGIRNSSLAIDADHVFFIAEESLWKVPKPGRIASPQAMAKGVSGLGLAVDGADLFFTRGQTSQIFRMPRAGGEPSPLVTASVQEQASADSASAGQGVVADDHHVYWTFEGRLLRVNRSGGTPDVIFESKTLEPRSLAADDGWLYLADGKVTYRLSKANGAAPKVILDCSASYLTLSADRLYAACGADLWSVSLDGSKPELLDRGPSAKEALAAVADRVYFADDQRGTIEPSLLVLSFGDRPAPTAGKPGFEEAVLSVRRWIRELGRKDAVPPLDAPVRLHLEPDLEQAWSLDTTVGDVKSLREISASLHDKSHPLLGFESRYAWRLLSPAKLPPGSSKEKSKIYRLARQTTVLISHRTDGGCPYAEVIAAVARLRKAVVPTEVYFEAGYDCE